MRMFRCAGVYYRRNDMFTGESETGISFEPMAGAESRPFRKETVWSAAADGSSGMVWRRSPREMESLIEQLLVRRSRVKESIDRFRNSDRRAVSQMGRTGW